jgi:hypothetical protein
MQLTKPVFTLPSLPFLQGLDARQVTARDLILLLGGLFLIIKSVHEIHAKLEEGGHDSTREGAAAPKSASFAGVLIQIALIDILFSLDSVITAIGIVDQVWIMVAATCVAMLVMLAFAGPIAEFVNRHPTVKMLALSFLILIGARCSSWRGSAATSIRLRVLRDGLRLRGRGAEPARAQEAAGSGGGRRDAAGGEELKPLAHRLEVEGQPPAGLERHRRPFAAVAPHSKVRAVGACRCNRALAASPTSRARQASGSASSQAGTRIRDAP